MRDFLLNGDPVESKIFDKEKKVGYIVKIEPIIYFRRKGEKYYDT